MVFRQFYLGCLAHASYLIGDEGTGTAVVVDPQRDVQQYLDTARELGLAIRHVILTHFHADFVAGHLELRDAVGATIHLGAQAKTEYPIQPQADHSELRLGAVRLEFLETPGHTPESICVLVFDEKASAAKPQMILTGDTLFIGDVGRPDLMASGGIPAEDLAGRLYHSLYDKILPLPDEALVYPAHGAGSLCGKRLSEETVSTLGQQKQFNYALRSLAKDEFIAMVTENQPHVPQYFSYDAEMNRKEHRTLEASLASGLKALTLDQFLERQRSGAVALDTRPDSDFNAAHLRGAVQAGLDGRFATWAGAILPQDAPILIIADPGTEREAEVRLGRIGFDHIAGYLECGMKCLLERPEAVESTPCLTAAELIGELESGAEPFVLDVRNPGEFAAVHFSQAANIPLVDLPARLGEIPADRTVTVTCASGYRSTVAASVLLKAGRRVRNLLGGMTAVETEPSAGRHLARTEA